MKASLQCIEGSSYVLVGWSHNSVVTVPVLVPCKIINARCKVLFCRKTKAV